MNREQLRLQVDAWMTQAKAAWAATHAGESFAYEPENQPAIDLTKQVKPYVMLDIVYYGGEQLDMSAAPRTGQFGQIIMAVGAKTHSGTRDANLLLDHLRPFFEMKDVDGLTLGVGQEQRSQDRTNGWTYYPLLFNLTRFSYTTY